jgi:hypothetical protein
MDNELGCTINGHGVSFSASRIQQRVSSQWSERLYQRISRAAFAELPPSVRSTWLFCFMPANIGIDVFPDSIDIFQVLPRGVSFTEIPVPLFEMPIRDMHMRLRTAYSAAGALRHRNEAMSSAPAA